MILLLVGLVLQMLLEGNAFGMKINVLKNLVKLLLRLIQLYQNANNLWLIVFRNYWVGAKQ